MNDQNGVGVCHHDPIQPSVTLIGSSLYFSDQFLRVLGLEFDGVRFKRISGISDLLLSEAAPKVVIIHETVPDVEGWIDEVRRAFPDALVALACSDIALVQSINGAGAFPPVSLLQMNAQLDVWFSVLRLLLCGHAYVPVDPLRRSRDDGVPTPAAERGPAPQVQLTPRELEILPMIAEGKQNKMIAGELGLSEHTVKLHTHNIFSKLRVSNRTGAANWYLSQVEGRRNAGHDFHAK